MLDVAVEALLEFQHAAALVVRIVEHAGNAVEVVTAHTLFHTQVQHRFVLNQRRGVERLVLLQRTGILIDHLIGVTDEH